MVGDDSNDEDEEPYFCQITGFIVDQMNKSQAALSWLVPKPNAPCIPFSPRNYTISKYEYETKLPLINVTVLLCTFNSFANCLLLIDLDCR